MMFNKRRERRGPLLGTETHKHRHTDTQKQTGSHMTLLQTDTHEHTQGQSQIKAQGQIHETAFRQAGTNSDSCNRVQNIQGA